MKNKIFLTFLTIILTANAGFSLPLSVKNVVVKFSYAMGGVLVSSLLIFLALSIYNKLKTNNIGETSEEEILKTPKTKDDAINFFIRKNRLR